MIADRASITSEPAASGGLMRRATYASIAVAGLMILIKLAAWLMTDSVSLLSSLLDSLLDAASSLVNLIAVHQALAPADREHRFGHGKAEPLASLGQAAFIAGSAVLLLIEALQHLLSPVAISNTRIGIGVMLLAIVVTLALVAYQRHVVRRTNSLVVSADAFHYETDLVLNGAVIVSLLSTALWGWVYLDPIFGAAIGLWIIYGAWRVGSKAVVQLMDRELPDAERAEIRRIALAHPQVKSVHDLRTRAAGPNAFVQIHLEMDGKLTLDEAHRISDTVEADILAAFPRAEVMIHQDPEGVEEPRRTFAPAR
ncbi:MAG TPA: cation diffusion facilitator family transporter [Stellaceae bacterium]|jgi:ferrous-iron efflux pump FieF|nr:cation diffusion facilitator family transporter [Stellaceae bacterium]